MFIDCDTYMIIARSGHPAEYTTRERDDAVGAASLLVESENLSNRLQ